MRIKDIIDRDLIVEQVGGATAEAAFAILLERLGRKPGVGSLKVSEYLSAVTARHRKNPCGLIQGLAFPNARMSGLSRPCMVVGRISQGIDLGARDGGRSHVILLYLGRNPAPPEEQEMLGRLSRALADPAKAERLLIAENGDDLLQTLESIDADLAHAVREGHPCPTA